MIIRGSADIEQSVSADFLKDGRDGREAVDKDAIDGREAVDRNAMRDGRTTSDGNGLRATTRRYA